MTTGRQAKKVYDYTVERLQTVQRNYVAQRARVRKFSAHQLIRLRQTYKFQQKTLNKVCANFQDFCQTLLNHMERTRNWAGVGIAAGVLHRHVPDGGLRAHRLGLLRRRGRTGRRRSGRLDHQAGHHDAGAAAAGPRRRRPRESRSTSKTSTQVTAGWTKKTSRSRTTMWPRRGTRASSTSVSCSRRCGCRRACRSGAGATRTTPTSRSRSTSTRKKSSSSSRRRRRRRVRTMR